ncbi:Uncharacterized protein APZ42_008872, partial [Daphnia magna]
VFLILEAAKLIRLSWISWVCLGQVNNRKFVRACFCFTAFDLMKYMTLVR